MKTLHPKTIVLIFSIVSLPVCFSAEVSLTYDANGNLVTGDGFYREYNSLNQLSRIRLLNSTGIVLETYVYDPVEEKVLLKNVSYTNGTWKETVYYWFDEYVEVNNASGWFNFTYVEQDGVRVAELRGNIPYYILDDHLGSSTVITNASGAVIENTSYTPFGTIISGGTQSRYDYTGQEFDSVIGDYDYHARRYKSDWGKLTSADKIVHPYEPQSLNHYSYVENNPYKFHDPDGKDLVVVNQMDGFLGFGHAYAYIGDETSGFTRAELVNKNWVGDSIFEIEPLTDENGNNFNYKIGENERALRFETSKFQDLAMLRMAQSIQAKGSPYDVFSLNCEQYVTQIAKAGGLNYNFYLSAPNWNFDKNLQKNELIQIAQSAGEKGVQSYSISSNGYRSWQN